MKSIIKFIGLMFVAVALAGNAIADDVPTPKEDTKTTGVIARDPDKQIKDLNMAPAANSEELNNDERNPRFFLEGEFRRQGWELYIGRRHISLSAQGTFQVPIPIRKETISLVFTIRGPEQKMEREKIEIRILDWEIVKKKIEAAKEAPKEAPPGELGPKLQVYSFRAYSFFSTQDLGGLSTAQGINLGVYSYTGGASWNPSYRLLKDLTARLNIGLMPVKKLTGGYYLAADYFLALAFPSSMLLQLEAGGGAQTWVSYGGTQAMAAFNLLLRAKTHLISTMNLDYVFFGYSLIFETTKTRQLKMGVQVSF